MIDNPRVDLAVAKYGRSLVIAAIAIGILSLVATGWVLATPTTTTINQETGTEVVETEVLTSAVVVQDGLWERDAVLEERSIYTLNDTPDVTLETQTSVPSDETSVSHVVTVRYTAEHDGQAFWDETDEVVNTSVAAEDGVASTAVTLDVRDLAERLAELEDELAGVGTVSLWLDVTASYDTGANADERHLSSEVGLSDVAYWFDGELYDRDSKPVYTEVEVTETPSSTLVVGLAFLSVAAFAVGAFVSLRPEVDVATARRAVHERRYAEWISHGTIPMWIGDHHIALDTLEDVVDVAIDTSERVVHDRQRGLFAVVTDDVVYYYSDRGVWEETAWPDIDLERRDAVDPASPQETAPVGGDLPDPDDEDAWNQI
ncbi:DUF5305 domain-containing protein [Natronobiforma cellulositropha]|uniref:DUF5305 domain-containing protein n=1 Tax=Natronobiforma cellulositropha TaxID=1679076 RepID=UPI0021D57AA3|nr:DUF5305 domain-containing protein [Natronobiforma cellulositropha]